MIDFESALVAVAKSRKAFPVDFDNAWKWIGYTRKDTALRALTSAFSRDTDFSTQKRKSTGGRPTDEVTLTVDCFKAFCMMAGTDKGREVRAYYLEVERRFKKTVANTLVEKSKEARKGLTSQWMRHGLKQGWEFGTATRKEYEVVFGNPDVRKANMGENDLKVLLLMETLESLKLDRSPGTQGLVDVQNSLEDTGRVLGQTLQKLHIGAAK